MRNYIGFTELLSSGINKQRVILKALVSKPQQVTFKRVTHASEPEQWPTYYQLEYTFQWLLRGIKHKLWANSSLKCYVHYHSKSWRKLSTDQSMKDKDHSSNRQTSWSQVWKSYSVSQDLIKSTCFCLFCLPQRTLALHVTLSTILLNVSLSFGSVSAYSLEKNKGKDKWSFKLKSKLTMKWGGCWVHTFRTESHLVVLCFKFFQ